MTTRGRSVDVAVIGSGYGGAVIASRLAASMRVCVLERGAAYPPGAFPRTPDAMERAVWDPEAGRHGIYDVRELGGVDVLVASGLGGGSLISSSVLVRPGEAAFGGGEWPLTLTELEPHYKAVEAALGARPLPPPGEGMRGAALQAAAGGAGRSPQLGIVFGDSDGGMPGDPLIERRPNLHHRPRYTCRFVAECNIGCNYGAKNSLDYTCLTAALAAGAELRTACEVKDIRPCKDGGFEVRYLNHVDPTEGSVLHRAAEITLRADRVVLAAGAAGSTELLLRSASGLRGLSRRLGEGFGTNGESIMWARNCRTAPVGPDADEAGLLDAGRGPVTTWTLAPDDGEVVSILDVGYPDFLSWLGRALEQRAAGFTGRAERRFARTAKSELVTAGRLLRLLRRTHAALAAPADLSGSEWPDGVLGLIVHTPDARRGAARLSDRRLVVDWAAEGGHDRPWPPAAVERLVDALGGTLDESQPDGICLQPRGGCCMGSSAEDGVVDSFGRVFGQPGLYVGDASVVPVALGAAPALTVAALADRVASGILQEIGTRAALRPVAA